ncbi:hypothetical protein O181_049584 [Austropuccinia psidii MF-1]|uniref:Uncharacterized protein n=1 Tax=Austropuccinia psidii MF-1 TaxID=1389203 RepID=A0A9Q3DV42_9BASI|nr:hypothetical protein [Austropuccinia psidii MF-1]
MSCKGQFHQIKAWFKTQCMLSEDEKKNLDQGKENSPVEAPEASTSKNLPQQAPNKGKQAPKRNHKGKANPKWSKPYPQNYTIPKKEKKAIDNVLNISEILEKLNNSEYIQ